MLGEDFDAVTVGTAIPKDTEGNWPIALRFGTGGGNAVITRPNGKTATLYNIQAGETFPCRCQKVDSVTGTVADIVAIYEADKG